MRASDLIHPMPTRERTARSFETIDELTAERRLVTSEMVPTMSETVRSGGLILASQQF